MWVEWMWGSSFNMWIKQMIGLYHLETSIFWNKINTLIWMLDWCHLRQSFWNWKKSNMVNIQTHQHLYWKKGQPPLQCHLHKCFVIAHSFCLTLLHEVEILARWLFMDMHCWHVVVFIKILKTSKPNNFMEKTKKKKLNLVNIINAQLQILKGMYNLCNGVRMLWFFCSNLKPKHKMIT
jgi:hypothetical protein